MVFFLFLFFNCLFRNFNCSLSLIAAKGKHSLIILIFFFSDNLPSSYQIKWRLIQSQHNCYPTVIHTTPGCGCCFRLPDSPPWRGTTNLSTACDEMGNTMQYDGQGHLPSHKLHASCSYTPLCMTTPAHNKVSLALSWTGFTSLAESTEGVAAASIDDCLAAAVFLSALSDRVGSGSCPSSGFGDQDVHSAQQEGRDAC